MAKRAILSLSGLSLAILTMAALSGCFLVSGPGVGGYVFDAYSGNAIANTTVTIADTTGDTYSTTTNTSGKWFVSDPKQGVYTVSASGSGFYYTTPIYTVTYTTGATVTAQTIAGVNVSNFSSSVYNDLFVLVWNGSPSTLNLHLTVPQTNVVPSGTVPNTYINSPSWLPSGSTDVAYWDSGFGPSLSTSGVGSSRYDCSSSSTNPYGNNALLFLANDQGGGPVTIDMTGSIPIYSGYTLSGSNYSLNLFPASSSEFAGVAQLYIDANGTSLNNLGNAVVYAFQIHSGAVTPLGAYAINQDSGGQTGIPLTTSTVSVLRVNILNNAFQFVPDLKAVAPGDIRSASSTAAGKPQVFSLPR